MSKKKPVESESKSPEELIESLNAEIETLQAEKKELTEQLASAMDTIADQSAMLDKKPVATSTPTVEHGGKVYNIAIGRFNLGGEIFTAADVQSDSTLVERLLEMGSGVLVEQ